MVGLYSLNTPQKLFEKLVRSFASFCDSPSEDGIFEVIFPLYHLREWICPGGFKSYQNKSSNDLTKEEQLHSHLHTMPEYNVIRDLCNNAKHYNVNDIGIKTNIYKGMRVGYARAGDSLGITHFTVDGKEIRDYFWAVYLVYFAYFRTNDSDS